MARDFGAGLSHLGIHESVENRQPLIAIYSQNNPKWLIAAEAAWMYSVGIVPLYDTLGSSASSFIINQAKTSVVIVDTAKKVSRKSQEICTVDIHKGQYSSVSRLAQVDLPKDW